MNKNTFTGQDAIKNYLNPSNHITPLVELPSSINPFYDRGVRIYAKLLQTLPLANIKSIPAYFMLDNLQSDAKLINIDTLIESSSGNTALSLATTARQFGINKTIALVSSEVSPGKLKLLRLFGVDIIVNKEPICPDPNDTTSGIHKAKEMAQANGWINPSQYSNESNPGAHQKITAPQIYDQLNGDIQIFAAGLGTAGTMVGCATYFKSKNKDIQTVGVVRTPNNPVPGVRTKNLLNMSNFSWQDYTDSLQEVDTFSSYKYSLDLTRLGILAGPSSGLNLSGLFKYLTTNINKIDNYRNDEGLINCVFICCDTPLPYIDEYFRYLDSSEFNEVQNINLLDEDPHFKTPHEQSAEISPAEAFDVIYKNKDTLELNSDVELIDVRSLADFKHTHLVNSKFVDYEALTGDKQPALGQIDSSKNIYVICNAGNRSYNVVSKLKDKNITALSIKGGIIEWSNQKLPRQN